MTRLSAEQPHAFERKSAKCAARFRLSDWVLLAAALLVLSFASGCRPANSDNDEAVHIWGRRGIDDGSFQTPRALALGPDQCLYIVDKLGRIQVFDQEGEFLRSWRMPATDLGKPVGLSFSNDGLLMVADTHYFRILFYTLDGAMVEERTIGGVNGRGPGEFGFVTDVVQDSRGNYYVADYGDYDRIQKFSPEREYVLEWGGHGEERGEFLRPQSLAIDEHDHLWVADSCNHRIQVFDATGNEVRLVKSWGIHGHELGAVRYPYSLCLAESGVVYVLEYGNHRIQKFDRDGNFLGAFGTPGRGVGEFHTPWAFVIDPSQRIHVLDSYNQRVQRFPAALIK